MTRVLIRADADTSIGTGHLMRCLALAGAVRRHGGAVTFLSRCDAPDLRRRVEDGGHELRLLEASHPDAADLRDTLQTLAEIQPRWLVADGYHFDINFHGAVRRAGCRVLALDDDVRLPYYDVDVLLNQNLHAPDLQYPIAEGTRLLLGTRYALLRSEFISLAPRRVQSGTGCRVLVTMGGADPENVSGLMLKALGSMKQVSEIKVIVGAANPHRQALEALVGSCARQNVHFVWNPPEMRWAMEWADIVLSAAGTTCWELAATGSATLLVVVAENQVPLAKAMHEVGAARNLGWWQELDLAAIRQEVIELCKDAARREREGRVGRALVDGRGADRVAALLLDDLAAHSLWAP